MKQRGPSGSRPLGAVSSLTESGRIPDVGTSQESSEDAGPQLGMHWAKFIFVIYLCTCGGPFGLEVAIAAGYPMLTLGLILVVPIVWNVPVALMTAELGSAIPSNDGVVAWVEHAFGPWASFVIAVSCWTNYVVDLALYPVLAIAYLAYLDAYVGVSYFSDETVIKCVTFGIIVVTFSINVLGADAVGNVGTVATLLGIAPMVAMMVAALVQGQVNPQDWTRLPPWWSSASTTDLLGKFSACVNMIIWSNSGYESIGAIVEDLRDSKKTLTRTLLCSVGLSTTTYVLALVAPLGVNHDYETWEQGYFVKVAEKLGGKALMYAVVFGAISCFLGTFLTLGGATANELRALGEPEFLGSRLLRYKSARKIPIVALAIDSVLIGVFSFLPFDQLLVMINVMYCITIFAVAASFVKLRISVEGRALDRPYKAFSSTVLSVIFLAVPPTLVCLYILVSAFYDDLLLSSLALVYYVLLGLLFYILKWLGVGTPTLSHAGYVSAPLFDEDDGAEDVTSAINA